VSLPLDDIQQARHNASNVAEHAKIMHLALREAFFPNDQLADRLLVIWWENVQRVANQPDFSQLVRDIFPRD
jgi:hypothetical protein